MYSQNLVYILGSAITVPWFPNVGVGAKPLLGPGLVLVWLGLVRLG